MPTYRYGCDACGHRFDAFQRFADEPLHDCPECGASIRRLIQPVGVVFKGSGWYINDSRPAAKSEAPAADKAPDKDKGPEKGKDQPAGGQKDGHKQAAEKKEPTKLADGNVGAKREKSAATAAD